MITIEAIKHDMSQPRPMDRLLCGDVGYGKTEVAMRAAFKAVDAGYQVAVLVPTTVLAEQHHRTFTERMAEFPFEIAVAVAVRHAQAAGARSSSGWPTGSIDIVIGTHRLAQPDVQFHNLGLVIIDEEQRFGVEVKERLKALRQIGRRADDDGHAHPADAAHGAAGPARHLEPGDAARGPAGRRDPRRRGSTPS